jgi:hypothetical protein
MEDIKMVSTIRFPRVILAAVAASTLAFVVIPKPAAAVVVCKTAGVPQGCVAAVPAATAAVVVTRPPVAVVRPVVGPRVYRPVARVGVRRRI